MINKFFKCCDVCSKKEKLIKVFDGKILCANCYHNIYGTMQTIEIMTELNNKDNELHKAYDQRIAELEAKLEEVEGQYAYECECNKQLVELQEENEKLKKELKKYSSYKTDDERIKGLQDVCGQWAEENANLKDQLKHYTEPQSVEWEDVVTRVCPCCKQKSYYCASRDEKFVKQPDNYCSKCGQRFKVET